MYLPKYKNVCPFTVKPAMKPKHHWNVVVNLCILLLRVVHTIYNIACTVKHGCCQFQKSDT